MGSAVEVVPTSRMSTRGRCSQCSHCTSFIPAATSSSSPASAASAACTSGHEADQCQGCGCPSSLHLLPSPDTFLASRSNDQDPTPSPGRHKRWNRGHILNAARMQYGYHALASLDNVDGGRRSESGQISRQVMPASGHYHHYYNRPPPPPPPPSSSSSSSLHPNSQDNWPPAEGQRSAAAASAGRRQRGYGLVLNHSLINRGGRNRVAAFGPHCYGILVPRRRHCVDRPGQDDVVPPMSQRLSMLLDEAPVSNVEVLLEHAWNPHDCSYNLNVQPDGLTFHRQPVAQSTDAIRGKVGYQSGLHLFRIDWPSRQRGTHALVGVATPEAAVQADGYQYLLGSNEHSWCWDIGRCELIHRFPYDIRPHPYPARTAGFEVPDTFNMVLDMDRGEMGFVVNGKYLGTAFQNLQGKKLHVAVAAVWGHCEVKMTYVAGFHCEPFRLTSLCRYTIRKHLIQLQNLDKTRQLELPVSLQDFLLYQAPKPTNLMDLMK